MRPSRMPTDVRRAWLSDVGAAAWSCRHTSLMERRNEPLRCAVWSICSLRSADSVPPVVDWSVVRETNFTCCMLLSTRTGIRPICSQRHETLSTQSLSQRIRAYGVGWFFAKRCLFRPSKQSVGIPSLEQNLFFSSGFLKPLPGCMRFRPLTSSLLHLCLPVSAAKESV